MLALRRPMFHRRLLCSWTPPLFLTLRQNVCPEYSRASQYGLNTAYLPLDLTAIQAYALAYADKLVDTLMSTRERHVRLFRNGRNQALRIPREFELEGDEAIIHKEGDRLIVEPVRKGKLLALLATLDPLTEPFPDIDEDLPPLDDVKL